MSATSTETSAPLPPSAGRVFFQAAPGVGCAASGHMQRDDPVQKKQGKVTVKYDRKELRKRLILEEWIIEQLSELYDCEEEEMPEVEIDIDDLLEVNSEDERAVKLQESLTDCYKPTDLHEVHLEAFINSLEGVFRDLCAGAVREDKGDEETQRSSEEKPLNFSQNANDNPIQQQETTTPTMHHSQPQNSNPYMLNMVHVPLLLFQKLKASRSDSRFPNMQLYMKSRTTHPRMQLVT